MSAARTEPSVEELVAQVNARLSTSIRPKRIDVETYADGAGDEAWRLILVLNRPEGDTWDVESAFEVRRAVAKAFDRAIDGLSSALPGQTLVVLTTDEASEAETAPEEVPEPDE